MIQLLEEAIATLKHAQTFISSREKMHECDRALHQKTIDKLNEEIIRRNEIEKIKREVEDFIESKHRELVKEYEKSTDSDNSSLGEVIANFKKEQLHLHSVIISVCPICGEADFVAKSNECQNLDCKNSYL
jgi:hypothetical protein